MLTAITEEYRGATEEDELRTLLVTALQEEVGLLDGLRTIFASQREAVAHGDPHALDDGVFAATRVMRTMDEARRRRLRLMTRLLGATPESEDVEALLAGSANRPVRVAREQMREAAARLRGEVSLLRRILSVALEDNQRYLGVLLGEEQARPLGPPSQEGGGGPSAGAILNTVG